MLSSGVRLGDLTLLPRRQLIGADGPVAVGRRALDILSVLAEADGALVTKDELMAAVWPGVIVEENAIQVHVAALRKALGDEAPRLVTVRGLGYRLEVAQAAPLSTPEAIPAKAVAVLPFANLTGDPGQDYLGDGIAEEIITTLSQARGLRVPARTSTFAYKGQNTDIRRIAADLGVGAVLEGSVRTAGDRVRVTAQLIDAATGFHLWAQNYDRELRDLFDLQDAIAGEIARELKAKLGASDRPAPDAEAYRLYLQAIALMGARALFAELPRAIDMLERAIALDPNFAAAWARQSGALVMASNMGLVPLTVRAAARLKAEEARRLEPDLAIASTASGALAALAGQWVEAEKLLRHALERDELDPMIHHTFAYYVLAPCGHLSRARAEVQRGFELAPAEPLSSLGQATFAGMCDAAPEVVLGHIQTAMLLGASINEPSIQAIFAEGSLRLGRLDDAAKHASNILPPARVGRRRRRGRDGGLSGLRRPRRPDCGQRRRMPPPRRHRCRRHAVALSGDGRAAARMADEARRSRWRLRGGGPDRCRPRPQRPGGDARPVLRLDFGVAPIPRRPAVPIVRRGAWYAGPLAAVRSAGWLRYP